LSFLYKEEKLKQQEAKVDWQKTGKVPDNDYKNFHFR